MSKRSNREILFLLLGLLCIWGGLYLVNLAVHTPAGSQVTRQSKSGITYTTSIRETWTEGLLLAAGGGIAALYGLSRMRLR